MREFSIPIKDEHGSTLVLTMLTLVFLTLIGVSATTTSNIETQIANNEKLYKIAFFAADGGAEAGCELVEQNIELAGFATSDGFNTNAAGEIEVGDMTVPSTLFYMNEINPDPDVPPRMPADQQRDAYFQRNSTGNNPSTNLTFARNPTLSRGSALQMCAGYEGMGKGGAGGGAYVVYDIRSGQDSDVTIMIRWLHLI